MGHRSREICEEKCDVWKVNAVMLAHMELDPKHRPELPPGLRRHIVDYSRYHGQSDL